MGWSMSSQGRIKGCVIVCIFSLAIILVLCLAAVVGCDYGAEDLFGRGDNVSSRSSSLYEEPPPAVPASPYTVYVISDVHFGRDSRDGAAHEISIEHFTSRLMSLDAARRPIFILCLGDITEHGEESEVAEYAAWVRRLESIPNQTGTIKVYNAIGNHDLYNGGYDVWRRLVCPRTFYHFAAGGLSWYFIDTASGATGQKQFYAIKSAFEKDSRPKIVLSHFPFYADGKFYFCMQNTTERNTLISLFARCKVRYVFSGHTHEQHTNRFGTFTDYNIPSLLDKGKWAVLTIDGQNVSVEIRQ